MTRLWCQQVFSLTISLLQRVYAFGICLVSAILDPEYSEPGSEVTFVWGEEGGGSAKPTVERHVQTEIRAIVSPVPYSEVARTSYADGWRTAHR